MLFRGDDIDKPIALLSRRRAARVRLAQLLLDKPNVLVLDEPTNHLDIASSEALERTISGFTGTMLCVSHDRYFLDKVATRLLVLDPPGMIDFDGSYSRVAAKACAKAEDVPVVTKTQAAKSKAAAKESKPAPAAKKQSRDNPYLRPFGTLSMKDLEQQIAETEIAIADTQQSMADPATFKNASKGKALQGEMDSLSKKLKQLEAEYFEREDMSWRSRARAPPAAIILQLSRHRGMVHSRLDPLYRIRKMALLLSQLVKRYVGPDGSVVPVVDIEHFALNDGEQLALVGSSGSGKTTLLNLIAGHFDARQRTHRFFARRRQSARRAGDRPTSAVQYATPNTAQFGDANSINIAALSEAQRDVFRGRNIGYVFQTHHLLPGFTALENVLLGMSFTGRAHDPAWASHLLNEVGLGDRLHYKPEKLSVGQQQRVAVARALANRPKLVLGDEPTGALDPNNAQQVITLIMKLCTEVGASLLLVTHDPAITARLPRSVSLLELNRASTAPVPMTAMV